MIRIPLRLRILLNRMLASRLAIVNGNHQMSALLKRINFGLFL